MSEEVWKDIKGLEGFYQVSNFLRVRSLDREIVDVLGRTRKRKGQILRPQKPNGEFFGTVSIRIEGKINRISVSSLAYQAFIGNVPKGLMAILGDRNKDFDVTNLILGNRGDANQNPQLRVKATHIKTGHVMHFESITSAAKGINGATGAISGCLNPDNQRRQTHKGYRFEYAD